MKDKAKAGDSFDKSIFSHAKKGDVFFVKDVKGHTLTHSIIRSGLFFSGNRFPSIVHAGILLDPSTTIESSGNGGIGHFTPGDIKGDEVFIFRCKDKEASDLAADLAYNIEHSLAKNEFEEDQKNALEPDSAVYEKAKDIKYGLSKAIKGAFYGYAEMNQQQQNELNELVEKMDFNKIAKKGLYCSEFVALVYAMSELILRNSNASPRNLSMDCKPEHMNPSELYKHLSENNGWEVVDGSDNSPSLKMT